MTKYYTTSDLCLATTLSLWFPIERLDRTQGLKKILFVFIDDDDSFQKILKDYWSDRIQIEPKRFFNQQKVLKGRLYSDE